MYTIYIQSDATLSTTLLKTIHYSRLTAHNLSGQCVACQLQVHKYCLPLRAFLVFNDVHTLRLV